MPLKPLEKPNKQYLPKIIFILILLLSGSFLFKNALLKKNTLENTLGAETAFQESKSNVSLDEMKKQGEEMFSQVNNTVQKEAGTVLGNFSNLVSNTASNSATTIKEYIFENTVTTVLKEINKLSEKDQDLIKKQICQ